MRIRRDKELEMDNIVNFQPAPVVQFHEADPPSEKHASELLDEGLEESFPASDPAAVSITRIVEDAKGD